MGNLLAKLRWKRTDGRPASEQPTEDEGIRRDIPETEYEKQSPEKLSEAVSKQESIPEKTEPVTSSLVKETESSKTEVTKPSQLEEKKEISKTNIEKEPEVSVSNETEIENEDDNLEAVVKIQAGIRGYLTRKTLKEQRESVSPNKSPESHKDVSSKEEPSENSEKVILQSTSTEDTEEIPINLNDDDVKKAAVKIQSVYRGYMTRKNLSNIGDELIETSDDIANQIEEKIKDISHSEKESSINTQDDDEINEDENENGALEQAAVKIQSTFRGYQVRKQRKNGPKKEETKDSLTDTDEIQDESEILELNDSEAEGKAAVKIQAMYRGYKVRKEIKMIGEDGNQEIEDENNIFETETDTNIDEETDDGILKSKTTIVLSTPADKTKKTTINEEVLISFDTDSVQPTAESPSLLDKNDEEDCLQKPMVPINNETTIPKSVSEPTVDINSVTKSKDDHLLSPSSD